MDKEFERLLQCKEGVNLIKNVTTGERKSGNIAFEDAMDMGRTEIKLAPVSSSSYFNPFEVSEPITNDMIIEKMRYVKEVFKNANSIEIMEPEQILEALCIINKLELTAEEKTNILKKFNNHE